MQARLTLSAVFGLVLFVSLARTALFVSLARTAQAGRVVYFEILCDDKIVLDVSLLDQGEARFDAAWDYLKSYPVKNSAKSFVLSPEETARLNAFSIEPSKDDPLKATLKGKQE